MALDSYTGLKTAIADFVGRSDTTAMVDYVIDLCESWFNKNLRAHEMETHNGSLSASGGLISNPADLVQWKQIGRTSNGSRMQLQPLATEQREMFDDGQTGPPTHYFMRGGSVVLVPSPDSTSYTYDGTYYQAIPALSSTTTQNWVLTSHPDAYLFGSLAMTEAFYKDDSRIPAWKALAQEALQGIQKTSRDKDFGQAPVMHVDYPIY